MIYRITTDLHGNITSPGKSQSGIDVRITYQQPVVHRQEERQRQSWLVRELLISQLKDIYQQTYTIETLPLAKSSLGKPYLTSSLSSPISLGHSQGWAASCIGLGHEAISLLGIDIEAIRQRDWDGFAAVVFHPVEMDWIMATHGAERNRRGLTIWCCKEAILKAAGIGIALPLPDIAFSPDCRLTNLPASLGRKEEWNIVSDTIATEDQQAVFAIAWKIGEPLNLV